MFRNYRSSWLVAIAVTIVLAISQAADAQREQERRGPGGRRFGGFGLPTLRMAMNEKVQDVLKLDDEQKTKIEELDDQYWEESRKLLDNGGDREGLQKLSEETATKLADVLNEEQQKRLRGIAIQLLGAGAVFADPALAKELNVTEDQKEKLRGIQRENWRARGAAYRELRDLSNDERKAKEEKLRAEADKRLLDVLEPEQQEKLTSLKGEKVDVTMSEIFGRGRGGFRRDGGRRERDRASEQGRSEPSRDAS
jgi:Spy/CpxP family protein refolding chaperone